MRRSFVRHVNCVARIWLPVLLGVSLAAPAAEREVSFRSEGARFKSSEASQQAAAADANELVAIAKERFGIDLDRSENSVVELQRLGEAIRGEVQPWRNSSEWQAEREHWARLLGSYFGEVLVAHRGARWGTTDFIGGSDRALGVPRSKSITLPIGQMESALQSASSICGWYLLDISEKGGRPAPEAVDACSKEPWRQTPAEVEYFAAVRDRVSAARERVSAERAHDLELRKTSRTASEVREELARASSRVEGVFLRRNVAAAGGIRLSLTIAPAGGVTDAHVVSSDFSDAELEEAVLQIVRGLQFEARDVPVYTASDLEIRFSER
jgi:TonB family protein